MNEERKYKKVSTVDLLNLIGEDIPYSQDKKRDKQNDYKEELEQREPFDVIKHKIDRMQREINEQKNIIELLMNHTHDQDGKVVVSIDKTKEAWNFR